LHETAEEAVVAKRARVVEEVVISKHGSDRTETVRDTVRKTDVHVEQTNTQQHRPGQNA
jgi:stress response protein YsnF